MCELCSRLGIHRPRTKFLDVQKANMTYRKQRKHSRSQTRKITRRLLDLLGKILKMHKRLFGVEAKKVGGDTGYAGTENWDYCKANGIQTSFVKRGRPFGEKKRRKTLSERNFPE